MSRAPVAIFTAAEIAAGLGLSKRHVRNILVEVPAESKVQPTPPLPAWPLSALPYAWLEKLKVFAEAAGFNSADAFLAEGGVSVGGKCTSQSNTMSPAETVAWFRHFKTLVGDETPPLPPAPEGFEWKPHGVLVVTADSRRPLRGRVRLTTTISFTLVQVNEGPATE